MKKRTGFIAAAVAVAATVVITGCSAGSSTTATSTDSGSGPVVIARANPSSTFDGDLAGCQQTGPLVYDSLLRFQQDSKAAPVDGFASGLEPGLADTYTYDPAALTYTVHIREAAKFSNGNPVTADDIVWDLGVWKAGTGSGGYYTNILSAEAPDTQTVVFHLGVPDSFFAYQLTWCNGPIYPKDYAGMTKEAYLQAPIGAGPYKVTSATDIGGAAEKLVFEKNPNYWRASEGYPKASSVTIEAIADANQRLLQFQNGAVNIITDPDDAQRAQVSADQVVTAVPDRVKGYLINAALPQFSDVTVREAISLAINREDIASLTGGGALAAKSANSINMPDEVQPTNPYQYDVAKAKSLLAAAGVTTLSVDYLYNAADTVATATAQVMQSNLAEVGITLNLKASDQAGVISALSSGNYQMGAVDDWGTSPTNMDPLSPVPVAYWPWTGLDPSGVAADLLAAKSAVTLDDRQTALKKIIDAMNDQFNFVGVINVASQYAVQNVSGFVPNIYTAWNFDTFAGTK
ncbi:ABC transporter substrate-binding protein [Subtercola boreus]|uniref:ABC transporter substrate-binding protein n=1 Tax=Subtercola boreus TaxID=120213 RepID=UPI0011682D97|nr:ABC transporter substrate-binding protein [Subtercola boreus]TQL54865.1 ABC-type transport system substrate-binding protein [Subtercola boreus]